MRSPGRRRTHRAAPAPAARALPSPFAADSETARAGAPRVVHRTRRVGRNPRVTHARDLGPLADGRAVVAAVLAGPGAATAAGALRIANRRSDEPDERPVGGALAVMRDRDAAPRR